MSWKEELKTQLAAAQLRAHHDDEHSRELLRGTMKVAAKVLRFARGELEGAEFTASHDVGEEVLRLTLRDRALEVRRIVNGLAINVQREGGVIDLLHVHKGALVDGRQKRVVYAEAYFAALVVELVAD